jgi:TolB protein
MTKRAPLRCRARPGVAARTKAFAAAAAFFLLLTSGCGADARSDSGESDTGAARGCPADLREFLPGEPDANGPTWSPDGREIAFTASSAGRHGIYVLAVSDCRIKAIHVGEDLWVDFADWSPDGSQLAFGSVQDGIVVMRPDGSGIRHVTRGPDIFPSWSPDGRRIAFIRWLIIEEGAPTEERNVWIINADGSGLRKVTRGEWYGSVDWSPNGARLVTDDFNGDIVSIRGDGTDARLLVKGEHEDPSWSPDGRMLLLAGPAIAPADGGTPRFVGDVPGAETEWSPDGEWIAFTDDTNTTDVWIVRPNGTGARQLTRSRED